MSVSLMMSQGIRADPAAPLIVVCGRGVVGIDVDIVDEMHCGFIHHD